MAERNSGVAKYIRVSRRYGSLMTHHQLWRGTDHILLVRETGSMEEYKRFYFRYSGADCPENKRLYRLDGCFLRFSFLCFDGGN